jgi:hypothetical protein
MVCHGPPAQVKSEDCSYSRGVRELKWTPLQSVHGVMLGDMSQGITVSCSEQRPQNAETSSVSCLAEYPKPSR